MIVAESGHLRLPADAAQIQAICQQVCLPLDLLQH